MNCQEALDLLYDIIDREASEIDEQAVREHIAHCRHCAEIYRVESAVDDFIHAKLQKTNPVPKLEFLKSRVLEELDSMDGAADGGKKKVPFHNLTMFLAAAASIVLLLGIAYFSSGFRGHQSELVPLERAHWQASENTHIFQDSEVTALSVSYLARDLNYVLAPSVQGFSLIGARVDTILEVEMQHFLYADNGRRVSVFIAPASTYDIPEELKTRQVAHDEVNLFDHFCRGCRLVYHRMGDVVVITASTDKNVELLDFIPGTSTL